MATVEHLNLTVRDPYATGQKLCQLFDWRIRWQGPALNEGTTVHVGGENTYLALYTVQGDAGGQPPIPASRSSYQTVNGLNHIGIVVDDLEHTETCVRAAGFEPHNHADYEPGQRFYFDMDDGLEIEVISYARKPHE